MTIKTCGWVVVGLLAAGAGGTFLWRKVAAVSPAERHAREARRLARAGESVASAREWLLTVALDPRMPEAREALGQAFFREGANAFAIREFQALATLQPYRPHAYCQLAEALQAGGVDADALSCSRFAVKTEPDCPRAERVLGTLLLARGDASGGTAALEKAARLDPRDGRSRVALAQQSLQQGDLPAAERWSRDALRLSPQDSVAQYTLAGALLRRSDSGTRAQAVALLQQVIAANPTFVPAHKDLGDAYVADRRLLAARWEYQKAVQLAPGDIGANESLARVFDGLRDTAHASQTRSRAAQLKREAEAREGLEQQIAARPTDGQLMVRVAELYASEGNAERALAMLKRARDLVPGGTALAARVEQLTTSLTGADANRS